MNINEARALAEKKLAGLASEEELVLLQAFISEHPDKEALIETFLPIRELTDMPDQTLPAGVEQRILSNILRPSWQSGPPEVHPQTPIVLMKSPLWRRAIQAAVAVAAIIIISIFSFHLLTDRKLSPVGSWLSLSAPNGRQKSIILTDGTRIQLNGGSTIRVPENFSAEKREVILDGEAFFEVSKDSLRPFIVRTSTLSTTVLGTSFSMRCYSSELQAQVAVATGKVRVEVLGREYSTHSAALLTPGRMAAYAIQEKAVLQERNIKVESIGGWKDHIFYYDHASLRSIFADLQRSYDLHFLIRDSAILDLKYTTTFKNIPVQDILAVLEKIGHVTFKMKSNFIEVRARPSSISHS